MEFKKAIDTFEHPLHDADGHGVWGTVCGIARIIVISFGAVRPLNWEAPRGTRVLRATAASSLVRVSDFAVLGPPVVPGHHVGHRAHRVGRL